MIEMNCKIKEALIKMNFIKRYEELSQKYNDKKTSTNERLIHIDGEEILDIIQGLGYVPQFDDKEKFFKIKEEKIDQYTFGVHMILQYGMVDMVWIVKKGNELILGAPWGTYSRRIIDTNYKIKKPIFGTYEDIDDILKITFEMYEDFKIQMSK